MPACTTTGGVRYDITTNFYRFYALCAATNVPEIHDRATTIETWQQPVLLTIITGLSSARSEGDNRIVKHVGRVARGFRNPNNQRRRVRVPQPTITTLAAQNQVATPCQPC